MSETNEIPRGWCKTTIGEVADLITGSTPPTEQPDYYGGEIPFIKPPNLIDKHIINTEQTISELGKPFARVVPPGTTLISCIGNLGKTGITCKISAFNQQINAAVFYSSIDPKFGFYQCQLMRPFLESVASATTVSIVNKGKFSQAPFLIAPIDEQRRIVTKIEELFSYLDAGVATLERIRTNLKRYRASVLKAAVEGKLTKEWRKQNPPQESADKLLERILAERRRKWEEEQFAKYAEKGQTPPKGWQERYREPVKPDSANLPELPEGWCWATPEQLSSFEQYSLAIGPFGSNLKVSDYTSEGVPLVFVRNIRSGDFGGADTRFVSNQKAEELSAHSVESRDILITKMGDPPGDVCIYPEGSPRGIITADCIKFRVSPFIHNEDYFLLAIRSYIVQQQILTITKGVAQQKVSLARFSGIAIPVPPIEEQEKIIALVDANFSILKKLEDQCHIDSERSKRLRQSILKQAFKGKLVPQDPNDEPASVLLERIKAEQEAMKKKEDDHTPRKRKAAKPKG